MILKIFNGIGWVLYDKIKELNYINEEVKLDNTNSSLSKDIDYLILGGDHPVQKGDTVVKIYVRFEDDKEKNILATQSVYLCNDEGKTIEKIN